MRLLLLALLGLPLAACERPAPEGFIPPGAADGGAGDARVSPSADGGAEAGPIGDARPVGDAAAPGDAGEVVGDVAVPAPDFGAPPEDATNPADAAPADAEPGPDQGTGPPPDMVRFEGFSLDRAEVTVAAYQACVDDGACFDPSEGEELNWGVPGRDNFPVNGVTHQGAVFFCQWAGKRLPSQAEFAVALGPAPEALTCNEALIADARGEGCGQGQSQVCSRPGERRLCGLPGSLHEYTDSCERGQPCQVCGGSLANNGEQVLAEWPCEHQHAAEAPHPNVGFRCAAD